jgi:hypothetical protein
MIAWPRDARAQQMIMPVVGMLEIPNYRRCSYRYFSEALAKLAMSSAETLKIEYRMASRYDQLNELAADRVCRQVKVLAATAGSAVCRSKYSWCGRSPKPWLGSFQGAAVVDDSLGGTIAPVIGII